MSRVTATARQTRKRTRGQPPMLPSLATHSPPPTPFMLHVVYTINFTS